MANNRWMAAVLNLLIWGLGYLYLGKRTTFAKLIVLGWVASHSAWMFSYGQYSLPLTYQVISVTGFLISDFAFGYDAYQLAKEPPSLEGGRLPRSG